MPVKIWSTAIVATLPALIVSTIFLPPSTRTLTTLVFRWISTPSRARASARICAASRSSFGKNSGSACTITVREPKRQKACASSQPSGPPPIISRLGGSTVRSNTVSLVRKPASASPGIAGNIERDPVAIIAFLKRNRIPSTSTASPLVKRAVPKNTSMPSAARRAAESTRLMRVRMRRMRSIAMGKST